MMKGVVVTHRLLKSTCIKIQFSTCVFVYWLEYFLAPSSQ